MNTVKITVNKATPSDGKCELTLTKVLALQFLPILNAYCPLELKAGSIKEEGEFVIITAVLPEKIVKALIKCFNKAAFPHCQHEN